MTYLGICNWIDRNRARRIAQLLAVMWVLSLVDLCFTIWAHYCMPFRELNPVADAMLKQNEVPILIAYKVGLTLVTTIIFWSLRAHRPAEVGSWVVVLLYVALTLHWSQFTRDLRNQLEGSNISTASFVDQN